MENPITYLEAIIKPLMSNPEAVKIENKVDEMGTLLTITVAKEDMGKIIGKAGEAIQAIRRLIHQWGMTYQSRISIKISEPLLK